MLYCISSFRLLCFSFFFFKQKTAYEMRISDWSSDVCSSDLLPRPPRLAHFTEFTHRTAVRCGHQIRCATGCEAEDSRWPQNLPCGSSAAAMHAQETLSRRCPCAPRSQA